MEFISKNNQALFISGYITFENNKWNSQTKNYISYNFDGFASIKSNIKYLLIDEQNNLCCYCLSKLEKNDTSTIEHLYPNRPQSHNIFISYNINCIEKCNFNKNVREMPNTDLNNLPHDISYYNLLACCKKCNNRRDTKEIKPFIFDNNVNKEFLYNDKGNIYSTKYNNEILEIGLADIYYIRYRKIWRKIKNNSGINLALLNNNNKLIKLIKKIVAKLYLEENDLFYLEMMRNELHIIEAIKYRYFYNN